MNIHTYDADLLKNIDKLMNHFQKIDKLNVEEKKELVNLRVVMNGVKDDIKSKRHHKLNYKLPRLELKRKKMNGGGSKDKLYIQCVIAITLLSIVTYIGTNVVLDAKGVIDYNKDAIDDTKNFIGWIDGKDKEQDLVKVIKNSIYLVFIRTKSKTILYQNSRKYFDIIKAFLEDDDKFRHAFLLLTQHRGLNAIYALTATAYIALAHQVWTSVGILADRIIKMLQDETQTSPASIIEPEEISSKFTSKPRSKPRSKTSKFLVKFSSKLSRLNKTRKVRSI